jgi:hypothetical protein
LPRATPEQVALVVNREHATAVTLFCCPGLLHPACCTFLDPACRSVVKHLVGLAQFGGPRATPEQVALVLNGDRHLLTHCCNLPCNILVLLHPACCTFLALHFAA